jgi:L-amino acid N-acyltransferase YncA
MNEKHPGSQDSPIVRDSLDSDMESIRKIYSHYVLNAVATFEETPPSVDEMARRRAPLVAAGLPYLVATLADELVGYAYVTPYRGRPAYRFSVENSVYISDGCRGRGIGRMLLSALIERCEAGPWRQMIAVIADGANTGSTSLHQKLGFRYIGTLEAVGFKFGRWIETAVMQRELSTGSRTPPSNP